MGQRILVIDDDPAVCNVLKRGLHYEGYDVAIAHSGHEGLNLARVQAPDLIILDVMMPEMDGYEVLRRLQSADDHIPVLMLTAKDAPTDQVDGLTAGADDYVTKPFIFAVLHARVQALLRRQQIDHPTVLRYSDLTLDMSGHLVRRGERHLQLTALEFRLLQEFMTHPQQVLAKDQLLERVWEYDFGGNSNVVEVYVKQLRQKLEANGEPRLLHTLRNVGYVLREE